MLDFDIVLQNEQILLRPMRYEDLVHLWSLANDSQMWIYFSKDLSKYENLKDWVEISLCQIKNMERLAFTIIDKLQKQIIGSTSFGNLSIIDKRIEIGWTWIGTAFQGTEANKQIKYLMLKYCFEENDFERVEFKTDVLNIKARKALLKIGMVEEGILRSHTLMSHNRRRDTIYYSVLRSEWGKIKEFNKWI